MDKVNQYKAVAKSVIQDGTELIIADWLLKREVLIKDLVLGFRPPIVRTDAEFAVA